MKRKLLTISLLILFIVNKSHAQDAHYWESSFSPGGSLLPGAVIANDRDSGLFYYNPALLAIHPKNSVSISANIYEFERVKIRDGIGRNKPLKSSRPRIVPQMVSGTLFFKNKLAIGYALIHNPIISYTTGQRQDKQMDVLDNSYSPGLEYYVGQYSASNHINQTIASISVGRKLNERLALGFTMEVQQRSQDIFEDYRSRAIVNTDTTVLGPVTSSSYSYEASYTHIGMRMKAGLSYDAGKHHFGLLLSSPMITLKGFSVIQSDLYISNLHIPNTGLYENLLANDRQTKLPAKYKLPFSIAAAYAVDYNKGQIYLSAEYFSKVSGYNIINPRNESFIRPDTGNINTNTSALLRLRDEHKKVTNFALGISYHLNPNFTALGSFRTDFSYATPEPAEFNGNRPYKITWDTWHAQLGGNFRRRKFNLRSGLLFSYGRTSRYKQPVNFDNPNEYNLLLGTPNYVKGVFFSTGLLFSYIHNL